ncbi:MAG: DUF2812 domain-containing protein [Clostridium sp.]
MMRVGNSKLVILNFLPHEYKSVEKYLEDMALKGWKLKSLTGIIFKFKRIEPKRIKYTVDVMDKISFFDGKNSDRTLEYREYCKEAGWNFICERDKIQIYCSENEIESIPIHTDEREKYNCIFKASLKYVLLNVITILMFLYMQYVVTIGSSNGAFLASNLQLATLSFVFIFAIHEVVGLVNFIIWALKGLKSLKNEERVGYDFHKSLKLKSVLYRIMLIMAVVQIVFLVMLGDIFVLKFFILNIIMIAVIVALMNLVSRTKYKYKKMRKINITIYVAVIIITFISMNWLVFNTIFSGKESNNKIKPDNYILTLKDFNDEAKDGENLYAREENSFLASRLFYSNVGKNMTLQYELFQSKYEWAVKYHINKEIKFAKEIDVDYMEKDIGLPEDIKIYMNEHGHIYFMVSKDKVIEISSWDDSLSEEELLNKVYDKVFK